MNPNKKQKVSHKLGMVWRELGVQLNKEHQGGNWGEELTPDMLLYAAEDSWSCSTSSTPRQRSGKPISTRSQT